MDLKKLFKEHLLEQLSNLEGILEASKLDGLVISAGGPQYYFEDDQEVPYRQNHHFSHYCPLEGHNHALILRPSKKPKLLHFHPSDFWYDHSPLLEPFWLDEFEVATYSSKDSLWKELSSYKDLPYLGPDEEMALETGFKLLEKKVWHQLCWYRGYKTPYEAACMDEASKIAASGHKAAREAFLAGGSELDIHLAYLAATRMTDNQLPYNAIVGLNEKAAILHYAEKRDDVKNGDVLLIDSGAKFMGYGSDITRTYAARGASQSFIDLLLAMEKSQKELCDAVLDCKDFGQLHNKSNEKLAEILLDHGLLKEASSEEVIEKGLTRVFYPHGIGHMLGLFVHDVGGKQKDKEGGEFKNDPKNPHLRTGRDIEPGFLFTVEPGLYFIDMLLEPHRQGKSRHHFNFKLIDELRPFGGIRIEDNLYISKKEGVVNLTRKWLP